MVAKLLRVLAHAVAVVGCLLGITGLVEWKGKWEIEFYDCLKVVGLYRLGAITSLPIFSRFVLSTIYTDNSLYTFSEVQYAQTSYSLPDSQVGFPIQPPLNMSCYPSDIAKILLTLAKGFLDWLVMFLDQFWLSFDWKLVGWWLAKP